MVKTFKQNDNNIAITYYRYSSHAQNEASIDQQRELARKYADEHGLYIIKEYADEALTGTTDERPQYQLMIREIAKIKPSTLIVYKIDRLGRNQFELASIRYKLRELGVQIYKLYEPNLDPNDPMSSLMDSICDGMAEYYSMNLRQNVMRGMNYNATHCLWNGVKTLGYKKGPNKSIVIDDEIAPVILRIFNKYADGMPLTELANELNSQGIRTSLDKQFTVNGLRSILKNRAYIGEYHYGNVVVPDGMPVIVPKSLFKAVQDRFESNKHVRSQTAVNGEYEALEPRFWLTGKLYCGYCKETMQGISGTSHTGAKHYYYACKNHRKHKCDLKNIRKELLEDAVVEIIKNFLADSELLASLAVDVSDYCAQAYHDDSYLKSLQAELKKAEKEVNNLVNAVKSGLLSEAIAEALSQAEEKKKGLISAIADEEVKLKLAFDNSSIQKYFEMYKHADFSDDTVRNTLLDYFIDKIYVFEDKLIIDWFISDDRIEVDISEFIEKYSEYESETQSMAVGSTKTCSGPLITPGF